MWIMGVDGAARGWVDDSCANVGFVSVSREGTMRANKKRATVLKRTNAKRRGGMKISS
jgi:hypothetical protein